MIMGDFVGDMAGGEIEISISNNYFLNNLMVPEYVNRKVSCRTFS